MVSTAFFSAAAQQLRHDHARINAVYVRGALQTPVFAWDDTMAAWGTYTAETCTMCFSTRLLLNHPWPAVVEVLKHEMAHQMVHEIFHLPQALPHGEAWQRACKMLGMDPIVSGDPVMVKGEQELPGPLRKARKLLALAEKNSDINEAASALAAVQRMMAVHHFEMSTLQEDTPLMGTRWLGAVLRRVPRHHARLAALLDRYFHVACIWIPSFDLKRQVQGSQLEMCGELHHLDIAEHAYDCILRQLEELWRMQSRQGQRAKYAFFDGVLSGFESTFQTQQMHMRQEGLVWLRDPKLHAFFKQRHPRVQTQSVRMRASHGAYAAGVREGKNLKVRSGILGRLRGLIGG